MQLKKFDSMNVIPFIDIMLVLLAIVLTFSTFMAEGRLNLKLPEASTTSNTNLKFTQIAIDVEGKVFLNSKEIEFENLKSNLSLLDKSSNISLRADENTPFKTFVKVIDVLKEAKLEKISIVTELQK